MTKRKIVILLCLLAVSGCVTTTPRKDLHTAQNLFLSTVNTLTILRDNDKLNDDDIPRIKTLINSGYKYLDIWTEAVLSDEEVPGVVFKFESILEQLIEYRKAGEQ